MKILHICSDFAKQSIYDRMVAGLSKLGIEQNVFVPVRTAEEIGKYQNHCLQNVSYRYEFILKKWDRFFYFSKIRKVKKTIEKTNALKDVNLMHAHFLFSDGGVAHLINKKTNIPYIVAVRNTDINIFFKYFKHLKGFALKILENSERIIFLSPAYRDYTFQEYIPAHLKENLLKKTLVIPNGINEFWLANRVEKVPQEKKDYNFLYVGDFTKNKNIDLSVNVLEKLNAEGANHTFTIVGGGGDGHEQLMKSISGKEWVTYVPRTNNLQHLKEIYNQSHIFLMPSQYETFGLVYIEAMSQGLPVIYTKGQGIDGFFAEGTVGYPVAYGDIDDYFAKLKLIFERYNTISKNCTKFAGQFSWDEICMQYMAIYTQNK